MLNIFNYVWGLSLCDINNKSVEKENISSKNKNSILFDARLLKSEVFYVKPKSYGSQIKCALLVLCWLFITLIGSY